MPIKPLNIFATQTIQHDFQNVLPLLTLTVQQLFEKHDYDMFVFRPGEASKTNITLEGYSFKNGDLKEGIIVKTIGLKLGSVIWFKIDDYGEYFVGTFLYPSEY